MKKLTLLFLFAALTAGAQTSVLPDLNLIPFSSGYNLPVGIENAGDERLFIVERPGRIRIAEADGRRNPSHFLNIEHKVLDEGFEQGLLGLAFHPDYEENGYFFINYINLEGNTVIARYSVNPNNAGKAQPNSEVILMEIAQPFANHNGGQMKFGPDGYLYISLGDGGDAGDPFNNAQNTNILLGKILRIDVDAATYTIPSDNPYVGIANTRQEIWNTGLRNPWRFSFDATTGDMWIADVGQNSWEEINFQPVASTGGENYGWSCMEGMHPFKQDCNANATPFTAPVAEYAHSTDTTFLCSGSITGGFVYRGTTNPDMYGKYFYTDFCTGIFGTVFQQNGAWRHETVLNGTPFQYTTFGEDVNGELYVAANGEGVIYKLNDANSSRIANFGTKSIYLYPNPSANNINLEFISGIASNGSLEIFDLSGRSISLEQKDITEGINRWNLNIESLKNGYYILRVFTDHEIYSGMFIKN